MGPRAHCLTKPDEAETTTPLHGPVGGLHPLSKDGTSLRAALLRQDELAWVSHARSGGALVPDLAHPVMHPQARHDGALRELLACSAALRPRHLDAAFLHRRRTRGQQGRTSSQPWYVSLDDWVAGTAADATAAPAFFDLQVRKAHAGVIFLVTHLQALRFRLSSRAEEHWLLGLVQCVWAVFVLAVHACTICYLVLLRKGQQGLHVGQVRVMQTHASPEHLSACACS